MARPRGIGRRCSFESLEDRRLLAGDVTAKIVHGNLVIKGDHLDNGIAITAGANPGDVVVTGVNAGGSATNVNGTANGAVTLSGFTGKLTIKMKGGDDSVTITGITTSGKAKINEGRGDDTLDISDSTFDRSLTAKLGQGVDTLSLDSTTVAGKAKVSGRSGTDDATITDSTFSKLGVSLGKGDDSLTVSGTTVSDKTKFNGQGGANTYTDDGDNSLADMKARHFTDPAGTNPSDPSDPSTPSDEVTLNPVSDISEGGTATLTGTYTDSDTSNSHTLKVDWGDPNSGVDSTFAIPAAASLSVGQTITSSTDSAVLTITSLAADKIGYSVQHRYLDDGAAGGSSTGSDTSSITVTVTDSGTFSATKTTAVVINDSAPTVSLDPVADVTENGLATLTGRYTDAGLLDAEQVLVGWGDPNNSVASKFAIPAVQNVDGTSSLSVNQTFSSSTDSAVLTVTSIDRTTGQVGFSVGYQYLDDGKSIGNVTTSDSATISVSVTDDDAKSGATTVGVTVKNAVPTLTLNAVTDITVNGTATLTGTFTDIGLSDEHGILVNWGDSTSSQFRINAIRDATGAATLSVNQTFTSTVDTTVLTITSIDASTGKVGFSVSHQYTAVGASIPISVGVQDDDTDNSSSSTTVNVRAVQPTLAVNPATINENSTATLTGSFTNAIVSDTHELTVSWADANNSSDSTFAIPATNTLSSGQTVTSSTDNAVLTITSVNATTGQVGFSVGHRYTDDGDSAVGNTTVSDNSDVLVFVTGAAAGSAAKFATVTVNNAPPTVNLGSVSDINANGTATLTGAYTDLGLFDLHRLTIDWDDPNASSDATFTINRTNSLSAGTTFTSTTDGSVLTITSVNTTTGVVGFSVQHQYTASGIPTVAATIADDDLGTGSDTVSFVVGSA